MASERLQKIIAAAGIASRRKAEELITGGQVSVNGQVVTELGTRADLATDHIRVGGKLLGEAERKVYLLLNKPRGYVSTASDPERRATVLDLVRSVGARLFPVGRLDYNSEGLLLLTNDGELAQRLTHASYHVPKTYLVKVSGKPGEEAIARLREGVTIHEDDGGRSRQVRTAPADVKLVRDAPNPWYEVTLYEGRNRQLHRMFEKIGHHVEKIKRVRYGPLSLDVETGEFRALTADEVKKLQTGKNDRPPEQAQRAPAAATLPRPATRVAKRGGPGDRSRKPDRGRPGAPAFRRDDKRVSPGARMRPRDDNRVPPGERGGPREGTRFAAGDRNRPRIAERPRPGAPSPRRDENRFATGGGRRRPTDNRFAKGGRPRPGSPKTGGPREPRPERREGGPNFTDRARGGARKGPAGPRRWRDAKPGGPGGGFRPRDPNRRGAPEGRGEARPAQGGARPQENRGGGFGKRGGGPSKRGDARGGRPAENRGGGFGKYRGGASKRGDARGGGRNRRDRH